MEYYTIDDVYRENAKNRFKRSVRDKYDRIRDWCRDHKDEIMILGPVILSAVTTIVKIGGKHVNLHKEQNLKDLYCYDRSLGHYWALRRELTNKEWLEIDARKKNGERLADILAELKVLK